MIYDLLREELIFKRKCFCGQIKTLTKKFDARIFKFNVNAIIKCITFANVAINNRYRRKKIKEDASYIISELNFRMSRKLCMCNSNNFSWHSITHRKMFIGIVMICSRIFKLETHCYVLPRKRCPYDI